MSFLTQSNQVFFGHFQQVISMFSVILGFLKINPVNGLAFVCLSVHFMMLGSFYDTVIINLQKVRLSLSY